MATGEVYTMYLGVYFVVLSTQFRTVWSYYCEWDMCGSDQYCCGDNLCCEYVYSLWYFWVGILFVVIVLSACGGLFRYCYYYGPHLMVHRVTHYAPLHNMGCPEDQEAFMWLVDTLSRSIRAYTAPRRRPSPSSSKKCGALVIPAVHSSVA